VSRSVCIVARRWRSLTSAMRAACAPPRLNDRSVGRPRHVEEVRRQAAQCVPALARALLGGAADEPHEHRHQRQRDRHHERRFEVDRGHPRHDDEGHDRREHDLGQVAGEVRLERLDPLHRGRRDLAGLRAVGRRRLGLQAARDDCEAQLGEHARRRAPARDLHPPGQRSAAREGERERDRVASQLARRRASERPGDDPRQ
jgi:hypothetical protein